MIEEELNFDGVDEICGFIEDTSTVEFLFDVRLTTSLSAPLK